MILHLLRPIQSQPVDWLPLDELVYEISSLKTPPCWHLLLSYLYLLRQDVIPYFLAVLPQVRSLPKHALVTDDPHSKVVHRHSMVLSAHDLRCYISLL